MALIGGPSSAAQASATTTGISTSTNWLYTYRYVILVLCSILNVSNLGLIAHWLAGSIVDEVVFVFEITGLIAAVATLVLLPAMTLVARVRKNAWFVYILTEVIILGILCVLWITTSALVIQDFNDFYLGSCSFWAFDTRTWCNQLSAIKGLSITIFVLLLLYVLTLVGYACWRSFGTGANVWFQTVQEQSFASARPNGAAAATSAGTLVGSPSAWDEKPTVAMYPAGAAPAASTLSNVLAGQTPSPAPSAGVAYPPTGMQLTAAGNSGSKLTMIGSSGTSLPAGAAQSQQQQYYSAGPHQVAMHVSRPPPQQLALGTQNATGIPVTPSYPQIFVSRGWRCEAAEVWAAYVHPLGGRIDK